MVRTCTQKRVVAKPRTADVNAILHRMRVLRSLGAKILNPSPANLATLERFARQNDGIEAYGRDFLTSGETMSERVRVEDIIAGKKSA